VFGVAYGQRQADVLAEEGVQSRNIRRWLDGQTRPEAGIGEGDDETFRLRRGDLLVVDEAGAAATPDLVAIHRRCEEAGAKLLLVGDPRQIGAVGAGGALADIAEPGITYELVEVRRFQQPWEGPASLRLCDGDTTAVADYAKHGRLVDAGTLEQAEAGASRTWLADTLEGKDALIVVGSNDSAARVSTALRAQLVRLGQVEEVGVPLGMQGTVAGVGDLVQARRNAWHLERWNGNQSAPINRTTYRVVATHPGGGLTVARLTGRDPDGGEMLAEPIQLPARYVDEHVTLAYASTVHAAHGRTVDTSYPVLGPGTDAASAYVQLTRGRETNVAFVVTRRVADDAATGETHTVRPRTAADVLADVVRPPERDPNRTALTEAESAAERAASTPALLDPLVGVISEALVGRTSGWLDQFAADGILSEHHRVALAADEARGSLDQLLRSAELAGHDPAQALRDAIQCGTLDRSASVAQVLHFRIRTALENQLAPRVDSYADLLPRELSEASRAGLEALAKAADVRRTELGVELAEDLPQWAREALGPVPDDDVERSEWERKAGWAGAYRELTGHTDDQDALGSAPPPGLAEQHALFRTAHDALDLPYVGADEEGMTEGRLRNRVAAYEHELRWAPRYVADELEVTHDALRRHRSDATVWATRADAEADPTEAAQLRTAAATAREQAEQLTEQVDQLELADDVRAAWWADTAVTRDNAERARVALNLRGIDLDAPDGRVTAEEWLAAERAAQVDAEREIQIFNDYELTNDQTSMIGADSHRAGVSRDEQALDGVAVVEPGPPDIRHISIPDPSERHDPEQRRRVPRPDETALMVERAHAALAELQARAHAAAAEAVRAVELEPDEDTRRAELARWAELDHTDNLERDHGRDTDDDLGLDF
jgi:hypothetical protein